MQIQYFKSSWGDIKNSPGWFGKICLLALINFIPVFGQIVTLGYVYGWAREIAWGTHEPMPARIFGNEDGKLYRRGWFTLVLGVVFAIIPYIVMIIGSGIQGAGFGFNSQRVNPLSMSLGSLVYFAGVLLMVAVGIFVWIGNMRIAIYDRLSAGFQFRKLWNMLRHDTGGMLRIFGMSLLVGLIIYVVLSIVVSILFVMVISIGVSGVIGAGYSLNAVPSMSGPIAAQFFASAGLIGFIAVLLCSYLALVGSVFIDVLAVRAAGYWTMQFDVPHWGGQDEPMPFEVPQSQGYQAPPQPPVQPQPGRDAFSDPSSPYASAFSVENQTIDPGYTAPTPPQADTDSPHVVYAEPAVVSADFIKEPEEGPVTPPVSGQQTNGSGAQPTSGEREGEIR